MTGDGITTYTDVGTLMDGLVFLGQPWMARGHCAQTDPEAFYPEKGGSTREAKSVCHGCPVAAECLDYALEHDERHGIWGGLSERERRRIKGRLVQAGDRIRICGYEECDDEIPAEAHGRSKYCCAEHRALQWKRNTEAQHLGRNQQESA